MQATNKTQSARYLLIILLAAFLLFDLHAASVPPVVYDGNTFPAETVLRVGAADHLCPIRIPEKVLVHEEASQTWEHWNKRESQHVVFLLLFRFIFSFLLLSRTGMSRCIPVSTNLPYIRVLLYIHRKDGKGPENHIFS